MHDLALLSGVDGFTSKHRVTQVGHTTLLGQCVEQGLRFIIQWVLGKIHAHTDSQLTEAIESLWVALKRGADVPFACLLMPFKQRPCWGLVTTHKVHSSGFHQGFKLHGIGTKSPNTFGQFFAGHGVLV